MRFPTLVFDIETLTDLKAGAHLYHLDLPEADVEQALTKLRRQESGMDFQRLPLHEIVCISGLWIDESGFRLFSLVGNNILKLRSCRSSYQFLISVIRL